jgi:hypothetical protein
LAARLNSLLKMGGSILSAVGMKQGLKAQYLFRCVYGPAEAVPLLQTDSSASFSASCKALTLHGLKPALIGLTSLPFGVVT